jgi:hypothetical protein
MLTLAVGAAALGRVGEQEPTARTVAAEPERLTPFIYGARGCATCHVLKNRTADTQEELDSWICRMDEYQTFDSQDKHKLSFTVLTGLRGQQMNRLLGIDVTQSEAGCINCHSVPERGALKQYYTREDDGVTCVACHGTYRNWVLKHQIPDNEWYGLTRKDKERQFGMTDLWDPVTRAEICASCHIGNSAQGKVVTHAMYAAGHAPLPSFEAATFSDAQPRHWEYLREKQKMPKRAARLKPPFDRRNLEQTQLVVVSGLVSLRESMRLFADEAAANKPNSVGAGWPDFARFDCYACHHELQARGGASWRQVRRRDGQPGRPIPPDWPLTLIRLGIEAAGPEHSARLKEQLEQQLDAFHESIMLEPFGNPKRIDPPARAVVSWADALLVSLQATVFDRALARRLLDRLCEMAAKSSTPDYDSARQITWAFRIIYAESLPEGVRPDTAIEHALAELGSELALDLPPAKRQAPIETALQARLRSSADFDPARFKAHFTTIAGQLAKTSTVRAEGR